MTSGKRIVLSTFGSFGDVHPYIAVALELLRRGHRPVIATTEMYREKVEPLGIEFRRVRPDMPSYDEPERVAEIIEHVVNARTGPERLMRTMILPHLRDSYEDLLAAVRGADLLLTHPLPFVGPLVAEVTGVLWASSVLAPGSFLSIYDPPVPPQLPALHALMTRSRAFTRAVMWAGRKRIDSLVKPVYSMRRELGLARGRNPMFEGQHSPALVLALYSKVLGDPQADWPPNTIVTGFPFYDRRDRAGDDPHEGLAPALEEFLDAGEPPVVFTLGSSAIYVAKDFYAESVKAARELGVRALLLLGDERNRLPEPLAEGVAAFDYAPYGELLPRARAVVHQGGVGTTGQALRAGRPTLIVPHAFDQHDNAARAERLGVSRTLNRPRYKARTAARELRELLAVESYARRAEEVGRVVCAEDGARAAADALEGLLAAGGSFVRV
ncbi:MAG TPA: nucleotide disphospho-sugar-binding domain-containing protein [Pyrinomonadaceae bacterium]|nr:nucleotide disphospho-sugar-binding domain-containing protein [Pyrinomonadaceae bacterium]